MPKFFIENKNITNNIITIQGKDVNHIKNVLRKKSGDQLEICNKTTQQDYICEIDKLEEEKITCKILKKTENNAESKIKVTIYQGLPKSDKMELVIQKSVELGVYEIAPVEMKRCVVKIDEKDKNKKIERWQKISEVASKQCGRDIIPKINNIVNVKNICDFIKNYDIVLVAYENEIESTLKEQLKYLKQHINYDNQNKIKIGVVIGPEGGLEEQDVELLKENEAKIITLGKRILRTETAGMITTAILIYEIEQGDNI